MCDLYAMQILRQLNQNDYPEAAKKTACVLTCLQMIIEHMTQSQIEQKIFYTMLLNKKIIRQDAYVNSYDDALRLIIMQIAHSAAIVNPALVKAIAENMVTWCFSIAQEPTTYPAIGFLGGHAVLVTEAIKSEAGDIDFQVIDPNRRGSAGRYVIQRERIKRFGGFA